MSSPSTGFFSQFAGEIVVGVVTAILIGIGAVVWQLFIHPRIQAWQRNKAADAKRDESIASLNGMTFSYGSRRDHNGKCHIGVTLPNTTSRPLIIREVSFRPTGGARLHLFHDPNDKYDRPTTKKTRTGIEIPPQSQATWYYISLDMRGQPMIARRCSVKFEYQTDTGEVFMHEMDSPSKKEEEIARYFQFIWDDMSKKLDEKKGKQSQPIK